MDWSANAIGILSLLVMLGVLAIIRMMWRPKSTEWDGLHREDFYIGDPYDKKRFYDFTIGEGGE